MKHIFTLAVALGIAALSQPYAAQAQATAAQNEVLWDWWFVWAGGASPSREVIYIDSLSVDEVVDHTAIMSGKKFTKWPIDYIQAEGVLVSENIEKPAKTSGRVRVKCDARQIMFDTSYQLYWDTDRSVTVPPTAWFDIGNELRFVQIAKFLCEPKSRTDKNMMMRVDQSSDPMNVTWSAIWNDAKKPEFTTKKTRAEIDAEYETTLAQTKKIISDSTTTAEKRLEDMNIENAFMASVRKNFQSKGKKFNTLFYSMPGWDEAEINSAWGAPLRAGWEGETRLLVYPYQDTVYDQVESPIDVMQCQGGGCNKVGETTQTSNVARTVNCERVLYLRPGGSKAGPRLVDYAWKCF